MCDLADREKVKLSQSKPKLKVKEYFFFPVFNRFQPCTADRYVFFIDMYETLYVPNHQKYGRGMKRFEPKSA